MRAILGNEAGTELIELVDKLADDMSALGGDIAELRHQTELGFARVDVKFAQVDAKFADIGKQMERQTNKLILWTFAFWATTLLSIATLTLTSRR